MIILERLSWSNAFSYGENNSITFTDNQLTQLVGHNGHGKSSIALILEEVLFNKNSKGVKKTDILNRYIQAKSYSIELTFVKNGVDKYRIETKRGSTQQVKLFKNDVDISSHTSTATYKTIESILGFDHKTFSQIVYQSHSTSLEFLTSPDTARKKFLIELLNLSKYTKIGEIFKEALTNISKESAVAQGHIDTISAWIDKYNKLDLEPKPILKVPEVNNEATIRAASLLQSINTIEETNKKISKNNTYKTLLANITVTDPIDKPSKDDLVNMISEKAKLEQRIATATKFKGTFSNLKDECPTCAHPIDIEKMNSLIEEQNTIINTCSAQVTEYNSKMALLNKLIAQWEANKKSNDDFERYHQLIDNTLPDELLNLEDIQSELDKINNDLLEAKVLLLRIEKENLANSTHNSKIDLVKGQIEEMKAELDVHTVKFNEILHKFNAISVLVKAFSTTGLVAYKIENLIKDLEDLSNLYLTELSSGRFQISFKIADSDKLSVVITDNGVDIDIQALSVGETSRVNVSVLLAIRRLMQSLSDTRINLLFLDETISTLDPEGKEQLIQVLLNEENLNTLLVSHDYTHPLLAKVNVVKDKQISIITKDY